MARPTKEEVAAREAAKLAEENEKVSARVLEILPGLLAQLTQARAAAGTLEGVNQVEDKNWATALATAIVKAGDPTNQNRMIDPQIARQRADAHDRMVALIMKYNAEGVVPIYVCRAKMYIDDVLVDPQYQDPATKRFLDTRIRYSKIPNEGMIPINDAAMAIHAEFKKSIGSVIEEGLPKAPWLVADAPWVQTKDGIVRGRENEPVPELSDTASAGPYNDPRVGGHSPLPATPPLPLMGTTGGAKLVDAV